VSFHLFAGREFGKFEKVGKASLMLRLLGLRRRLSRLCVDSRYCGKKCLFLLLGRVSGISKWELEHKISKSAKLLTLHPPFQIIMFEPKLYSFTFCAVFHVKYNMQLDGKIWMMFNYVLLLPSSKTCSSSSVKCFV